MKESRPKVLALYQAVLELLDEGRDINSIKVSDITKQAGIGKGTAYEYFKSKEELIACALLNDVEEKMLAEEEKLEQLHTFGEKISYALDWLLCRFHEQKSFTRLLRLTTQPCEVSTALLEELRKRKTDACSPGKRLLEWCQEGKEKGEIRKEIPVSAACTLTLGNFMAFVIYLERQGQMSEVEETEIKEAEMKEFLCDGLLNQLK